MLMPKKVKHRKQFKGRMKGAARGGTDLNFGDFGLQAVDTPLGRHWTLRK